MSKNDTLIKINQLYKIFGDGQENALELVKNGIDKEELLEKSNCVLGLNNINLNVKKAKIQVVMGLSGSGKSTLIRHLNRLIEPTSGEILVNDTDILQLNTKELVQFRQNNMSMVFQKFALFPHKTVLQNVGYGLAVQNIPKNEWEEKATKWINRVGLEGYETYYPGQLSGGMQQRVGLARALATDAEILLMDEAFSALDPLIRSEMQNILLDLQGELHKTIIFITHDLDEALKIGDRIAILRDGSMVQDSDPQEIIMNPADDYVSDFIKDINRARVIQAKSIMTHTKTKSSGPVVQENMVLEDILQIMSDDPSKPVTIENSKGNVTGKIEMANLIEGIKRPKSQGTNITG
ncbi:glycine betaine/L-proline ABC transporter ATP-binding protein [Alphaproteobacteria bacterium]|nr:glycine betaine/L-proline ABC transporter ATP-binding protein [Alphaproteobacteria bacterium]MDC6452576.1 glycine betaine/L-proline ABC transporter ATP-binding protein [Alphaproteobacteria bacterium]